MPSTKRLMRRARQRKDPTPSSPVMGGISRIVMTRAEIIDRYPLPADMSYQGDVRFSDPLITPEECETIREEIIGGLEAKSYFKVPPPPTREEMAEIIDRASREILAQCGRTPVEVRHPGFKSTSGISNY